eukprot:scaffold56600_cov63-Phaeocystis_antarctica.AAC.1
MGRGAAAPDRAECADEDAAVAQSTFLRLRYRMCIPSPGTCCRAWPLAWPRMAIIWPLVSVF